MAAPAIGFDHTVADVWVRAMAGTFADVLGPEQQRDQQAENDPQHQHHVFKQAGGPAKT
jgi:hypothetical protein